MWEDQGHDASTWPGLDDLASELAWEYPALGIGREHRDYAEAFWALLRDGDERMPQKDDQAILTRAVELLDEDPEGEWDMRPLSFSTQRFEQYLTRTHIPWPRLDSGALALDDDTFKEMAKAYPDQIGPLREVRHLLSQMKLHALAVGHDGRNRCLLSAFGSRTGRNQPSNSAYIFGPSCWLRGLIKPGPGRAVAYLDWSQQELAIAAALSQDPAMMEAYQSGDFYLTFAKMAGAAPPHATKASHGTVRETFKVISLGVLYGLSEYGLARRLGISVAEGRALLDYHKTVFRQFWRWSDQVEMQGMLGGCLQTAFGWRLHAGPDVNPRTLRNFPMQGAGGEMLRLACCLATERNIQVCAPVHDALLIEAEMDRIEQVAAQTQAIMREASELVLPGFPLRSEAKIIKYPDRYMDPRGVGMWDIVQKIIYDIEQVDVPF
jgi:hypothetical protein